MGNKSCRFSRRPALGVAAQAPEWNVAGGVLTSEVDFYRRDREREVELRGIGAVRVQRKFFDADVGRTRRQGDVEFLRDSQSARLMV